MYCSAYRTGVMASSTPMLCFIRNGIYTADTAGDYATTQASAHALSYHNASSSLYTELSTDIDVDGFMSPHRRPGSILVFTSGMQCFDFKQLRDALRRNRDNCGRYVGNKQYRL